MPLFPDWLVLVSSVLLILIPLQNVLFVINKWLKIKCSIEITGAYFHMSLKNKSPFYNHAEVKVWWEQFKNFEESDSSFLPYVVLSFLNPEMKFCLSPVSILEKDLNSFRNFIAEIQERISSYNTNASEKHLHIITRKSIFASTGARIGAVAFTILIIAITIGYYTIGRAWQHNNWIRILWLWCIRSPFLIAVFGIWKRKK